MTNTKIGSTVSFVVALISVSFWSFAEDSNEPTKVDFSITDLAAKLAEFRSTVGLAAEALKLDGAEPMGRTADTTNRSERGTAKSESLTDDVGVERSLASNDAGRSTDDCLEKLMQSSNSKQQEISSLLNLPSFPGLPHLYHVGATGFFLDYFNVLMLKSDQHAALMFIKRAETTRSATAKQLVRHTEQELSEQTGTEQPDGGAIEQAVQRIGRLKSAQRICFIRAVGEAALDLSPEQAAVILANMSSQNTMTFRYRSVPSQCRGSDAGEA
jgi:hypothetical protein